MNFEHLHCARTFLCLPIFICFLKLVQNIQAHVGPKLRKIKNDNNLWSKEYQDLNILFYLKHVRADGHQLISASIEAGDEPAQDKMSSH